MCRVGVAGGIARCELLITMDVSIQHKIGIGRIERLPEGQRHSVLTTGGKERMMPVGQGAAGGMGGEIGTQPALLRRPRLTTDFGAVTIEDDDMPGSQVVAVVALGGITGGGAEVAEVA